MSLIGRTYESSNSPSGITASILRKHEASQGSPLGFLLTYSFRDPGIGPKGMVCALCLRCIVCQEQTLRSTLSLIHQVDILQNRSTSRQIQQVADNIHTVHLSIMSSTFKKHTHHVKRKGYLEGHKNLYNHFPLNGLDSQTVPSGVAKLSQPIKKITGAI